MIKTNVTKSITVKIFKRSMMSRATNKLLEIDSLNHNTKLTIGKSILSVCNMITTPKIVSELFQSVKNSNVATPTLTCEMFNKVLDKSNLGTTPPIVANILPMLCSQNKHIALPISTLNTIVKVNSKVEFNETLLQQKYLQIKHLPEIAMAYRLAENFGNTIKSIEYLGDTVKTRNNRFPDYRIKDFSDVERFFDSKSGSLTDNVQSGNIYEIPMLNGEIINAPRDYSNIYDVVIKTCHRLNPFLRSNPHYTTKELELVENTLFKIQQLSVTKETFLLNSQEINENFLTITFLENTSSALNLYHTYNITNRELTPRELAFLERCMNDLDPQMFNKPCYMQAFLISSLRTYQQIIDSETFRTIKPLRNIYPFVKETLKYNISDYN